METRGQSPQDLTAGRGVAELTGHTNSSQLEMFTSGPADPRQVPAVQSPSSQPRVMGVTGIPFTDEKPELKPDPAWLSDRT